MSKSKKQRKFIIPCPNCKSNHDVSEQMNNWRDEFIEVLEKALKEFKK